MPRKPARLLPFRDDPNQTGATTRLLNLGPKSSAWLAAIGLTTLEEIRRLGPIEVCRRLRHAGQPVSVLLAYALEGALRHCHWNEIPGETKQALATEFRLLRREAPWPAATPPRPNRAEVPRPRARKRT